MMACESWERKIDAYVDSELSADELRRFNEHIHDCASCASEALGRLQLKRAVQAAAGKRFSSSPALRQRIAKGVPAQKRPWRLWDWAPQLAAVAAILLVILGVYGNSLYRRNQLYAELADLHVATLASSTPVDVVSSDKHTVKPWFQGKLPFTFNLPELAGTPFTLVGGRVSYLAQEPGAQLIFAIAQHRISVFIFQSRVDRGLASHDVQSRQATFSMESWSEGDLRYFIIGDAGADDIHKLSELLRIASRS